MTTERKIARAHDVEVQWIGAPRSDVHGAGASDVNLDRSVDALRNSIAGTGDVEMKSAVNLPQTRIARSGQIGVHRSALTDGNLA